MRLGPESTREGAVSRIEPVAALVHCAADVVHLMETLFVRLFMFSLVILVQASLLSIGYDAVVHSAAPGAKTVAIAACASVAALVALRRPWRTYRWLRRSSLRQLLPAGFAATAVLVNGPDSPSWWIAIPILWVVGSVSSTRLTVAAATLTAVAFLAGTLVGAHMPVSDLFDNVRIVASAVGLPAFSYIGRGVIFERFASLVFSLEHDQPQSQDKPRPPLRVVNRASTRPASTTTRGRASRQSPVPFPLTARQLEVALLIRDGLHQSEVAECLGISIRQVERHLRDARERTKATTTCHLIAILATSRPHTHPDGPASQAPQLDEAPL